MQTASNSPAELHDGGAPQRRLSSSGVALTFDDGPDPHYTGHLLDLLAEYKVLASFFVLGSEAVRFQPLIRRIMADGHTVGSHGWHHLHAWRRSRAVVSANVVDGAHALSDVTGQQVRWFRPPFGGLRRCLLDAALRSGQRVVLWNRSAIDWGPFGTLPAITRRLQRVAPGDIVLMHDACGKRNRPSMTLAALPALIEQWQRRQLDCIPLDHACLPHS